MNKQFLLFLFAIVVALCLTQCKQECTDNTNPDCPNYCPSVVIDPCAELHSTSAAFIIEQRSAAAEGYIYRETSRVMGSNLYVRFRALEDSATYTWHLGAEVIATREFERVFPVDLIGQTISVMLVVQREPNLACFPNDNGIDTLVKQFQVISRCDLDIHSTFRGAWDDNPLDSFIISIPIRDTLWDGTGGNTPCDSPSVVNIEHNGDSCDVETNSFTNNYLRFGAGGCSSATGEAFYTENDGSVLIAYQLAPDFPAPLEDWIWHYFRGRRIQ